MHQAAAVLGVVGHADRTVDARTAAEAGAVIVERAVPAAQGRGVEQRLGPGRAHAPVDQHDRLSGPVDLVLELDAVDRCALHENASSIAWTFTLVHARSAVIAESMQLGNCGKPCSRYRRP